MAMVRWRPRREWNPIAELQEEMDRLLSQALGRWGTPVALRSDGAWLPPVDIYEDEDNVHVKVDLPGLRREDIEITVQNNLLTIKGERKQETETKEENTYRTERVFGMFTRLLELPSFIDEGKVEATFRDGVLHIRLPKTPEAKPKQIKVRD